MARKRRVVIIVRSFLGMTQTRRWISSPNDDDDDDNEEVELGISSPNDDDDEDDDDEWLGGVMAMPKLRSSVHF